jgi:hypothetical protein
MRWLLIFAVIAGATTASRADVFAFNDVAGFETCLQLDHVIVTVRTADGTQTRFLSEIEIQLRCIDAAVRLAAPIKSKDTLMRYVDAVKRLSAAVNALPLIDLVVGRSTAACNDIELYEVLMRALERPSSVASGYIKRAKPIVVRCLKDSTFRKDFLDELASSNKHLAANACDIALEQKLVKSCKGSRP